MKWLRVVLVFAATAALAVFVRQLFPVTNENLERVAELQDSIRARNARIGTLTAAVQTLSSMWADSSATWQARRDSANAEAEQARRNARGTAARLRTTLTAEQQVQLDSVTREYETALTNKDRIIGLLENDVRLLVTFRDSANALIGEQADQIRDLTDAHDRLADELNRGFALFGLRLRATCGPSLTAGYGLKGPDVVLGAGCSLWADRKPRVDKLGTL